MTSYDEISTLMATSKVVGSNTFARTEGMPLDSSSVFKTYADLVEYAASSGKAYEGQVVAVGGDGVGEVSVYALDSAAPDNLRIVSVPTNLTSHFEDLELSVSRLCSEVSSLAKSSGEEISQLKDDLWSSLSAIATSYETPSEMSFNEAVSAVFAVAKALQASLPS